MAFLGPAPIPCANTSELAAAVKSITIVTIIDPCITTFLLIFFGFADLIVVIAT